MNPRILQALEAPEDTAHTSLDPLFQIERLRAVKYTHIDDYDDVDDLTQSRSYFYSSSNILAWLDGIQFAFLPARFCCKNI